MAKDAEATKNEEKIPGIDYDPGRRERPASYSMIEPRLKNIYAQFYKETNAKPCKCVRMHVVEPFPHIPRNIQRLR